MKISLIAIITTILMISTLTVNAQHIHNGIHANIGIKGGLNAYKTNYNNNAETDPRLGFHLGLLGHIHISNRFAVQPELIYSLQGAKNSFEASNTRVNLNYLNVPVMFQYMFDNGFRLQAGPQLGFLMNAKSIAGDIKTNVEGNYNTLEFGLGIGASYVHPATGFGVDARYNHGLSNILDNSAAKATNRGIQLGVFYLFKHRN